MVLFAIEKKMSELDNMWIDELAAELGRVTDEIIDLELEKIRLKVQVAATTQQCEQLSLEVAELSGLLSDVMCMERESRRRNKELRRELDELRSRL